MLLFLCNDASVPLLSCGNALFQNNPLNPLFENRMPAERRNMTILRVWYVFICSSSGSTWPCTQDFIIVWKNQKGFSVLNWCIWILQRFPPHVRVCDAVGDALLKTFSHMPNVIFLKKSRVQNKAPPLQLLSYLFYVSQKFFQPWCIFWASRSSWWALTVLFILCLLSPHMIT